MLACCLIHGASTAAFAQDSAIDPQLFVQFQKGDLPIILSAPHGGNLDLPDTPKRTGEGMKTGSSGFFTGRDAGTEELAQMISDAIQSRFGRRPYVVASKVHRKYLDPNRPADIAYEDPKSKIVYDHYHNSLAKFCNEVTERFQCGVLLDLHGQGSKRDTVFRGTKNGQTVAGLQNRFGELAFSGSKSLFGLLQSRGWTVYPASLADKEQPGFTGGFIVQSYGSHKASPIDAYQLEFGAEYRAASRREKTAQILADALVEYANIYLKINVPLAADQGGQPVPAKPTIRVAVFVDDGVSSTTQLLQVLASDNRFVSTKVNASDIRAGKLSDYSVLIHPGGSGSKQGKALGEEGRAQVRQFVKAGGGFVGICAGAYLAAGQREWSLNILDSKVVDREHWNRGTGNVTLALPEIGKESFRLESHSIQVYYHQGPLLAPGDDPDVPDFQTLATFDSEIAKNGAPTGVMKGTTAIALGEYGSGKVICFSPHPEKTPGYESLLIHGVCRVIPCTSKAYPQK